MDSPPQVPLEPDVVGRNLAYARRRAGLTLTELAQRAHVPISTLSNVEKGRRKGDNLKTGVTRRLCDVLEVDMNWFAGRYTHGASRQAPSAQDVAHMTEAERDVYIMKLVAESLGQPWTPPPPDEEG